MSTETHTPRTRSWTGRLAGRTTTIAALAAALTVGGIAAANWEVGGGGAGSADATTVTNLDVVLSADGDLYPGATVDGEITVTNDNPFAVKITAIEFDGTLVVEDAPGCTALNADVTFNDGVGLDITVPADADAALLVDVLQDMISMGPDSDNTCQGAKFSMDFEITAVIAP